MAWEFNDTQYILFSSGICYFTSNEINPCRRKSQTNMWQTNILKSKGYSLEINPLIWAAGCVNDGDDDDDSDEFLCATSTLRWSMFCSIFELGSTLFVSNIFSTFDLLSGELATKWRKETNSENITFGVRCFFFWCNKVMEFVTRLNYIGNMRYHTDWAGFCYDATKANVVPKKNSSKKPWKKENRHKHYNESDEGDLNGETP